MGQYSDMTKDIALLSIEGCELQPLSYNREALPELTVSTWGFSKSNLTTFPQGNPGQKGILSEASFLYERPCQNVHGTNKWNKKPKVSLNVFQFVGNFEYGFSGAPVCYDGDKKVIGIFHALDGNNGYVIPISTVLELFSENPGITIVIHESVVHGYTKELEIGNNYSSQKKYDDALVQYDKIINDKNYVSALNNKGWVLNTLQKYQLALEYLNRALSIDPDYLNALINKGWSLSALNQDEDAIKYYDRALLIDPNNVNALNNKGYTVLKLNDYEKAEKLLNKAISIDPNSILALYNMGLLFSQQGKYCESIMWYDKVLELKPDHTGALNGKGWGLLQISKNMEEIKEAMKFFEKVLSVNAEDMDTLVSKGSAYSMMGNKEEALKYYDRVLNINPSHASALNDKGISLTSKAKTKEEFENALSYFDRALSANPNYFEALINKGACMLKFKKNEEDFQEMLILLNKALSIRRNDSGVLRNMGITYNLWKRFDKSLECFDKILELEPKNTEILLFKAETLLKVEPEKSIEWFDKVLALEPNNERAEEGKRNALSI